MLYMNKIKIQYESIAEFTAGYKKLELFKKISEIELIQ